MKTFKLLLWYRYWDLGSRDWEKECDYEEVQARDLKDACRMIFEQNTHIRKRPICIVAGCLQIKPNQVT